MGYIGTLYINLAVFFFLIKTKITRFIFKINKCGSIYIKSYVIVYIPIDVLMDILENIGIDMI